MNKQAVIKKIFDNKIIAIIRGVDRSLIIDVVNALVNGGITLLEFTFDHVNENYVEDTISKIKLCKKYFGDKVYVGAGTVLSVEEVEKAIDSGAEFIISPNVNVEVIKTTNQLNKVSIPGALTPTEVVTAYEAGADFIKLFPAGELGKNYIKALMSPLKHIPFLAVGGITPYNFKNFLEIGVAGVGVGGELVLKSAIKEKKYDEITRTAYKFTKNINIKGGNYCEKNY
ncbi:MAG: 2-dehydro-3-deoxyphosphogluconate aldolase / (4S)-4-hydroxy-2-oxoglutarate aldolase [Thermosediminibacterales bacterium]|jgi:2-dehydro-3-deoxyphosphogluconate aldolase/(4S)-4-hydroxy-2-oxoglutarate aldolase|nr:2-dehydro-3-deoxyphosphogluconate aldolase / (4S)-4-hydroxy-2-oxoglutarate aldolase [Thermosediminibacterales bacterium]